MSLSELKLHNSKKGTPYTEHEDSIIKREVVNSPDNLTEGFKKASKIIGREWKSIANHYYVVLREKDDELFNLTSSSKRVTNTKNRPVQQVSGFKELVIQVLTSMPEKERKEVLTSFML